MTYGRRYLEDYQEFHDKELVTVFYVPKLSCNLLSVGQAADQNITVEFDQDKCYLDLKDSNGQMVATDI